MYVRVAIYFLVIKKQFFFELEFQNISCRILSVKSWHNEKPEKTEHEKEMFDMSFLYCDTLFGSERLADFAKKIHYRKSSLHLVS